MADFVRVPKTDWQDILDATRGKTGGTEKMLSGEVATAIAGITGGGGGVAIPGVIEIAHGSFVPASDVSAMTIEHGMTETPQLCAIWATGERKSAQYVLMSTSQVLATTGNSAAGVAFATGGADTKIYSSPDVGLRGGISSADATHMHITKGQTEKFFTTGTTYCWVAMVLDLVGGAR